MAHTQGFGLGKAFRAMKNKDIDHFFAQLAKEYPLPAHIWILGGAASILMGGRRPTLDIDFEVELENTGEQTWYIFNQAIEKTQGNTGIQAQYSDCTDRWSNISFLDFRSTAKPYKSFGKLKVHVFSPVHWSIGKIGRFLQHDCDDMIAVFAKTKPNPLHLAQTWHQALKKSPHSPDLISARKNMQYFLKEYGVKIWGKAYPKNKIEKLWAVGGKS